MIPTRARTPMDFGNWSDINCFKLCRSTIGIPGCSLHPTIIHWTITSSPKYETHVNFTANVGALCMADKYLYLLRTSASGTNLLVFTVESGKRWSVLATSASCVTTSVGWGASSGSENNCAISKSRGLNGSSLSLVTRWISSAWERMSWILLLYRDCKDVVGDMLVWGSGLMAIGDGSDGTGDGIIHKDITAMQQVM